jgi:hypothetical protein
MGYYTDRLLRSISDRGTLGTISALTRPARQQIFTHDEVIIFVMDRTASLTGRLASLPLEGGQLREVFLSELNSLALHYPHEMHAGRLRVAAERLSRGDRLFLTVIRNQIAHISWLGQRDVLYASTEVGDNCFIPLGSVASIIYECWTPPNFRRRGVYVSTLRSLTALAETPQILIYCRSSNFASQKGILRAGFQPKYRMGRVCLLGRIERTWVAEVDRI